MRHPSLRSLLIAASALIAVPAVAQDAVPPLSAPAEPEVSPAPPAPLIVVGEGAETPAPTIEAIPRVWAPVPRDDDGRSAYGLYLSARSALSQGQTGLGADLLASTEALTPEQPAIQDQAFIAALLAGDLDVAARITPASTTASPVVTEAGALVTAVQSYVAGDARSANASLKAHPVGAPHARAGALIAPWIAAAAGDWDRALTEPNPTGDPLILLFGRYHRALLLEHRRRYPEAEAALKALADDPRTAPLFRVSYGEFLERRGRRDEARAFYEGARAGNASDAGLNRALNRIASRGRPPALPDFRTGTAKALTAAAAQASSEGAHEFAVVYLRLSLNLDREPETLYVLGQTLS
ncbi:MAG: hypothetical protein K2X91_10825, partial [Thermoleophilia bacterium]|nr:hypothetical protein [Thermoleophilia bacterium]